MTWQQAVEMSAAKVATRHHRCGCAKECGVFYFRESQGDATRLHRGEFSPARCDEIEGFDDWETAEGAR